MVKRSLNQQKIKVKINFITQIITKMHAIAAPQGFSVVKKIWTMEQKSVVFDKLALEFPQHVFSVAEKSQIITTVCHPEKICKIV